ncbi:MAG: flavin reductase family protein [Methylococcales bacterium]
MSDIANLFKTLTHGIFVIGVSDGKKQNAFTAAWVMQASFDPLILVLSINPNHSSYVLLKESKSFSVNVLNHRQRDLAAHFGGPASSNKLASVAWHRGIGDLPVLDDALAYIECIFSHETPVGDHMLVVGSVVGGAIIKGGERPLVYSDLGDMDDSAKYYPKAFATLT